jgi:hypothetical protein
MSDVMPLAAIKALMPPEVQARWDAEEKRDAELSEVLRTNCYDAIGRLADAMRSPRIALHDLDEAIAMLTVARDCAKALDSE